MARAILTGTLQSVKNGTYNGQPDVALNVESGDDFVIVDVPAGLHSKVGEFEARIGQDVQLPCLATIRTGQKGAFIKWRLRAATK